MPAWLVGMASFFLVVFVGGVVVNVLTDVIKTSRPVALSLGTVGLVSVGILILDARSNRGPTDERFITDERVDIRDLLSADPQERNRSDLLAAAEDLEADEPSDAQVQQYVATAYWLADECEDALRVAAKATDLRRSAGTVSVFARAQQCSGDIGGAISALAEAIDLWPNDPTPRFHLAVVYAVSKGDSNDVLELATEALRLATRPNATPLELPLSLGDLHRWTGMLYDKKEEWGEAEKAYRDAINEDPRDGAAYVRLGFYPLDETGRYPEAVEAIRRGLELDPSAFGHYALAWLLENRVEVQDLREALQSYLAALERDAGYESARASAARLYERQGDLPSAVELLEEAPSPTPRILDQLSDYYARQDDTEGFTNSIEERLSESSTPDISPSTLDECIPRTRAAERPDLALACGELLILERPDDPWPLFLTALASHEAGIPRPELLERARILAEERAQGLNATPSDFEFLGYLLSEQGEREGAYAAFQQAIQAGGDPEWLQQFLDANR